MLIARAGPKLKRNKLFAGLMLQGVIRPGLLSLRERYRLRGRELAEDGLVLAEQLDAAREANQERQEELAALRRQVGWWWGGGEATQLQLLC